MAASPTPAQDLSAKPYGPCRHRGSRQSRQCAAGKRCRQYASWPRIRSAQPRQGFLSRPGLRVPVSARRQAGRSASQSVRSADQIRGHPTPMARSISTMSSAHLVLIRTNPASRSCTVRTAVPHGDRVLRTVHDLEPGRIMVVIGAKDPSRLKLLGLAKADEFWAVIKAPAEYVGKKDPPQCPRIYREADTGKLLAAILVGDRADYLDARNGVIGLNVAPPGGLTRTPRCAPWQWDFAYCGCHYWAAQTSQTSSSLPMARAQVLNFQRSRSGMSSWIGSGLRNHPTSRPQHTRIGSRGRCPQSAMILDWEKLPFVIAERETDRAGDRTPRNGGACVPLSKATESRN